MFCLNECFHFLTISAIALRKLQEQQDHPANLPRHAGALTVLTCAPHTNTRTSPASPLQARKQYAILRLVKNNAAADLQRTWKTYHKVGRADIDLAVFFGLCLLDQFNSHSTWYRLQPDLHALFPSPEAPVPAVHGGTQPWRACHTIELARRGCAD